MIAVSACLAGYRCRYDGGTCENAEVAALVFGGQALPVCPEQLGGLPTPRPPAEILGGRVVNIEGMDVTKAFARGAAETLRLCRLYGCKEAILKSRSPSCACSAVYDGSFTGGLRPGMGITAALLAENGIAVREL
ncbi:MAG: DUF523 domain-containing protein [Clostridiales bacterium]|nr:DUF523 domain-containing protein [Clostridiales bacterium]